MEANLALPAALIGDPVRAAILSALCDGRAHPAGALAYAARVSPQCASNHLAAKLTEGGLLAVETEGRHRYHPLATPHVAVAIEALSCIAPAIRSLEKPRTSSARSLRFAHSYYDHRAGRLGVARPEEARGYLVVSERASPPDEGPRFRPPPSVSCRISENRKANHGATRGQPFRPWLGQLSGPTLHTSFNTDRVHPCASQKA
jgi:DNA-binding transcriptional ArsR family regulator